MNEEERVKDIKFHGGQWVSFFPFLIFLTIAITISILQAPDIRGMWIAALLGIMITYFFSKEKWNYAEAVIEGMADKLAIIPVACWIFAGVFATILKEAGLVDGILWGAYQLGANSVMFVIASFIASALFATATGTSFGTIIAGMAVLYPAGVMLGADPLLMAGVIASGGAFGDHLAPISDSTIASAATQNTDIGGVVRSRIKYVIPASIIAIIAIIIVGNITGGSSVDYGKLNESMNPMGLIMLIPAFITIFLAIKGHHIISATTTGTVIAIIIAHLFKLNSISNTLFIQDGTIQGNLVDGVAGMVDLSIFSLLLMACVNIMQVGGGTSLLIEISTKVVKTARGVEAAIATLILTVGSIMGVNAPAILSVGTSYAKPMGEKYKIHPHRTANLLDAFGNTLGYVFPWTGVCLLINSTSKQASETFGSFVPEIAASQMFPWIIYCWTLLIVMIYAVITGYGRKFSK